MLTNSLAIRWRGSNRVAQSNAAIITITISWNSFLPWGSVPHNSFSSARFQSAFRCTVRLQFYRADDNRSYNSVVSVARWRLQILLDEERGEVTTEVIEVNAWFSSSIETVFEISNSTTGMGINSLWEWTNEGKATHSFYHTRKTVTKNQKLRVLKFVCSFLRPFLMALTDLDLKPGIVYYFFT